MIEFEFRRHSIKDGATPHLVGPKGHRLARAVGERQLRGRGFTGFFASGLFRTHQTMVGFGEGAGDFVLLKRLQSAPINLDDERSMAFYRGISKAEGRGEDLFQAAFAFDREWTEHMAREMARIFREKWLPEFKDGDKVLVVNHSPSMEIFLFGMVPGLIIPGMKECEGFRLFVERDGTVDDVHRTTDHPDLDPAGIRRELFPDETSKR